MPALGARLPRKWRRRCTLAGGKNEEFTLRIANAVWGQTGFPFAKEFLSNLKMHYGAELRQFDFVSAKERSAARRTINTWIEDQTEKKIQELIPEAALNAMFHGNRRSR